MRITIESTDFTTTIDGVEVRVWRGVTEGGIPCEVFVHRIRLDASGDCGEAEIHLIEKDVPGKLGHFTYDPFPFEEGARP
jgi:hypothetical protein